MFDPVAIMTGNGQGVTRRESTEQSDEGRGVQASDRQGAKRIGPDPGRRTFLAAAAGLAITGTAGCTGDDGESQDPISTGEPESTGDGMGGTGTPPDDLAAWRTMELTDVQSGETFTIWGLDGPVVIQSFAVWCPKCEQQSNNIAGLDDSLSRVSLNTDPNEDASKVQEHASDNRFGWRFAVAPTELTDELRDEFGVSVLAAPSTPIIVACEGGGAMFRSGSTLSASEIESIASDC